MVDHRAGGTLDTGRRPFEVAIADGANTSDISLAPDGGLFALVGSNVPSGQRSTVVRFGPDGVLDPAFSGDGAIEIGRQGASGPVADTDGSVYVGENGRLRRFLPDGSPDGVFGPDGYVRYDGISFASAALQAPGPHRRGGPGGRPALLRRPLSYRRSITAEANSEVLTSVAPSMRRAKS